MEGLSGGYFIETVEREFNKNISRGSEEEKRNAINMQAIEQREFCQRNDRLNLKDITPSEIISQKKKDKYCMIPLILSF